MSETEPDALSFLRVAPPIRTRNSMTKPFKMKNPPINEVVCGFIFDPFDIPSPFLLTDYVQEKSQYGFVSAKIVDPIIEQTAGINFQIRGTSGNALPFRIMIENPETGFLIQIQGDRFYLNWKRQTTTSDYPYFCRPHGIQEIAIREFEYFQEYVQRKFSIKLNCNRIDLANVDIFDRDISHDGLTKFSELMPMLQSLAAIQGAGSSQESDACNINIGFNETDGKSKLTLSLTSGFLIAPPSHHKPIYKLETVINTQRSDGADLKGSLHSNHIRLRELFFALLKEDTAISMFGIEDCEEVIP